MQIESERHKSRSAILVFRGRVVASIYGSKFIGKHLFEEEAFQLAVRDLASRGSKLSLYLLGDDIVLAAAALFHGVPLSMPTYADANSAFDAAYEHYVQSKQTGTMVLTHNEELFVCMVYFCNGNIVGLYSDRFGRLEPSHKSVKSYLSRSSNVEVSASVLPVKYDDFGFSLSGLADRPRDSEANTTEHGIPSYLNYYGAHVVENERLKNRPPSESLIYRRHRTPAEVFDKKTSGNHSFRVQP